MSNQNQPAEQPSDLSKVHALLQERITDLVAAGVPQDDVIEAALTVAVANKMKVHGARATAEALRLVSQFLASNADEMGRNATIEKLRRQSH